MTEKKQDRVMAFAEAIKELENIVGEVEAGKISLEESLEKYEAGMKLIKHCRNILERAERRIEIINREAEERSEGGAGEQGKGLGCQDDLDG